MGVRKRKDKKPMKTMKVQSKSTRIPFSQEEKENFYLTVKNSARVHRNRKKYHRPTAKRSGE
jgi:hypothetical protein